MKILFLLPPLFIVTYGFAQPDIQETSPDAALLKPKIKGNVQQFLRWTDRLGDNYLVLAVSDEIKSAGKAAQDNERPTDKELYAYHFTGKDSLLWKLNDFVHGCDFDNIAEFRDGATRITDLDNNGVAEIWIMYSLACSSDVSPRTLKLIMYQGNKKYAIRGTSQPSQSMADGKYGGKYNPGKEFQNLPQAFKDFAQKLWTDYLYDVPQ